MEARFGEPARILATSAIEREALEPDGTQSDPAATLDGGDGGRDGFVPLTDAELEFYRSWGRRHLREENVDERARIPGAGGAA